MAKAKLSIFQRILLIAEALLFLLLAAFIAFPLSYGSTSEYVGNASLQLSRCQRLAKNALIMQYGTRDEKTQALSDMQVFLPLFSTEQDKLARNRDASAQSALIEARPSHRAIVAAASAIIASDKVDARQVSIVVENSRKYNDAMHEYLLILEHQATDSTRKLIIVQEITLLLIAGFLVWLHVIGMQRLREAHEETATYGKDH